MEAENVRQELVKKVIKTLVHTVGGHKKKTLAEKLNLSQATLNAWEARGNLDYELLFNTFPEVSGDWLLSLGREGTIFSSSRGVNNNNINNVQHAGTHVNGNNNQIGNGNVSGISGEALEHLAAFVRSVTDTATASRENKVDNAGL